MKISLLLAILAPIALAQSRSPELRVNMISIGVKNMWRSVNFYHETLGLPLRGNPGDVTMLQAGEVTIVLNQPLAKAFGERIAGAIEIVFPVDSVAGWHDLLAGRGCHFVNAPHEVTPGTWASTFTDPDGHWLTLFGPK